MGVLHLIDKNWWEMLHQQILKRIPNSSLETRYSCAKGREREKSSWEHSPQKTFIMAVNEVVFRGKFYIKKKLSSIQSWVLSVCCWDCLTRIAGNMNNDFDLYIPWFIWAKTLGWEKEIFILFCQSEGQKVFCFIGLVWKGILSHASSVLAELTNKVDSLLTFSPLCSWLCQVYVTSSMWHFILWFCYYIFTGC